MSTSPQSLSSKEKLALLLQKARAQQHNKSTNSNTLASNTPSSEASTNTVNTGVDKFGNTITYNSEQQEYISLASSGRSCVCIGPAGTGKTTTTRASLLGLIQAGHAGLISNADGHKYLSVGMPGIVIVSYTRRAVANIRKNLPKDLQGNCITIHALLEYQPVYHDVEDPETGKVTSKMNFEPTRTLSRPLPSDIRVCVVEESSMVGLDLHKELVDALPPHTQFIYLGDIQQLPPVFGSSILGYKMLELPTVELKTVYRQALESPIIRLAHRILSGVPIPVEEFPEWKVPNQLTLHPWKKKLHPDVALLTLAKFLKDAIDHKVYDPETDMLLIPFNKSCGTDELNRHIANHCARKRSAITYEIIAGFNKHYFSVGDKVLYDKEDAIIVDIKANAGYSGASFQQPSATLDYWGFNDGGEHSSKDLEDAGEDIDHLLAAISSGDSEDRVRQASHLITVRLLDTDAEITLETAGEINALLMSYALTVHKSQGSEFRKVFLLLHQSHATMLQRELLYTAVTRAKEELYVICEPTSFINGIKSQKITGNTLAEKAEWFKGKKEANKEKLA